MGDEVLLNSFSLEQLGIFICSVIAALGVCIKTIQHSRCKTVKCCGCLEINRDTESIVVDDDMEMVENGVVNTNVERT